MDKIATVLIMGKQDLFGLTARFQGVCLAGIAEQVFFFFLSLTYWDFLLFQRGVEKRRGKPNAQAV